YRILLFVQAEDGIRDFHVTGVQTCALPIYVIGVNFQFRLGIDLGIGRGQQVAVAHFRQGLLCVLVDMNAPVKHGLGRVTDDAAAHLVGRAVRNLVLDVGVIVDQLPAAPQIDTVEPLVHALPAMVD